MQYATVVITIALLVVAFTVGFAKAEPQNDGCAKKAILIEQHYQLLEQSAYDTGDPQPVLDLKRRAFTLLVDVQRSLQRPACRQNHRTRLNEVKQRLENLMLATG